MMPVRRMIATSGKSSLISGSVSRFCHWALRRRDHYGELQCLGDPREAYHVALELGGGTGIPRAGHQPDLVIDQEDDAVADRRFVVPEPPVRGSVIGQNAVGQGLVLYRTNDVRDAY
jgi:hypothetical protein